MRSIILLLTLALSLHALEPAQLKSLQKCYDEGNKYNLGKTLAAICFHESGAGMYKINSVSNDYGLAQINLKTALSRLNLKATWRNKERVKTMLVVDDDLNLSLAIQELRYWRDSRKRNWKDMVSSYNQGNVIDNDDYYNAIVKSLKYLQKRKLI